MYIFYILLLITNNIIQLILDEETVIQKSDKDKKGKERERNTLMERNMGCQG